MSIALLGSLQADNVRVDSFCGALAVCDGVTVRMQVRRGYSVLLESKMERWHAQRRALVEAIQDLAAFYQALQALPRSTSTADLSDWFDHLIEEVRPPLAPPALLNQGPQWKLLVIVARWPSA